jgi:hypothetical protein
VINNIPGRRPLLPPAHAGWTRRPAGFLDRVNLHGIRRGRNVRTRLVLVEPMVAVLRLNFGCAQALVLGDVVVRDNVLDKPDDPKKIKS